MYKIAQFEKVSFEQFKKDWLKHNPTAKTAWSDAELEELYAAIKLPTRATNGSAGYDIIAMHDITVPFGGSVIIPTGIRCNIDNGWFLDLNPRSGHGFKYGIHLANTRGIIDSDYYNADNEGHIMVKILNDCNTLTNNPFIVEKGKGFCQGIFTIYGITKDDECDAERHGGFGSTDK
jgi:dUTP pyrophosphatase